MVSTVTTQQEGLGTLQVFQLPLTVQRHAVSGVRLRLWYRNVARHLPQSDGLWATLALVVGLSAVEESEVLTHKLKSI